MGLIVHALKHGRHGQNWYTHKVWSLSYILAMAVDVLAQCATHSPDVLFQELDGEAVLLDLKSEQYFGLDEVGTRIWQLMEESGELDTVYQTLLTEYEVSAEQLQSDLISFVNNLSEAGLITVSANDDAAASNR